MAQIPIKSKSRCYTTLWCIVNHNTCFRLSLLFWH